MSNQMPTIGKIVHYRLSVADVVQIERVAPVANASGHPRRNQVQVDDVYPAMVVRAFTAGVNLQVFLDGSVSYWATSRGEGENGGQWFWPPRT